MADKIKKLSDAIRLGATFRPQCKTFYFREGRSCALGAAAEAIGIDLELPSLSIALAIRSRFPDAEGLIRQIPTKNDIYGWTREQIADWVASEGC